VKLSPGTEVSWYQYLNSWCRVSAIVPAVVLCVMPSGRVKIEVSGEALPKIVDAQNLRARAGKVAALDNSERA